MKLGDVDISFRLGDASVPQKAYVGDTLVAATVPGVMSIVSLTDVAGEVTATALIPSDNGGATITSYDWEVDGVITTPTSQTFPSASTVQAVFNVSIAGSDHRVRAVNEAGPGPWSAVNII